MLKKTLIIYKDNAGVCVKKYLNKTITAHWNYNFKTNFNMSKI